MEKNDAFKMNQRVRAQSPLLAAPFIGNIMAKNVHTCILKVTICHEKDEKIVSDLQGVRVCKNETLEQIADGEL